MANQCIEWQRIILVNVFTCSNSKWNYSNFAETFSPKINSHISLCFVCFISRKICQKNFSKLQESGSWTRSDYKLWLNPMSIQKSNSHLTNEAELWVNDESNFRRIASVRFCCMFKYFGRSSLDWFLELWTNRILFSIH